MMFDEISATSIRGDNPQTKGLISCVISNFNYRDYLGQAIESALKQTVAFEKIIVVDDGSTDGSMELLNTYADRIKVVAIANSGQTGACLRGLSDVETEYVHFLDADDYLNPDFVETILPHLATSPVKVQFQLKTLSARTGAVFAPFPTYSEHYDAEAMQWDNKILGFYRSPPTSGNVLSTKFLRSFDHSAINPRSAIDSTLNLLAPYFGEVRSINVPLAFRRVHEDSLGQWSRPTPPLLRKELAIFASTWQEAVTIMAWKEPPFGESAPIYVLERELMIAALTGKIWLARYVSRFLVRISRSREPSKQRLLLMVWSVVLLLPVSSLRERIIWARRSPVNRSPVLEKIVSWLARR